MKYGKVEVNIAGWRVGISRFLLAAINRREPHMYYLRMTFNMSVTEEVGRSKVGRHLKSCTTDLISIFFKETSEKT